MFQVIRALIENLEGNLMKSTCAQCTVILVVFCWRRQNMYVHFTYAVEQCLVSLLQMHLFLYMGRNNLQLYSVLSTPLEPFYIVIGVS